MKWQYLIEVTPADKQKAETQLNTLGDSGWEVIAVWSIGAGLSYLLKREKSK